MNTVADVEGTAIRSVLILLEGHHYGFACTALPRQCVCVCVCVLAPCSPASIDSLSPPQTFYSLLAAHGRTLTK